MGGFFNFPEALLYHHLQFDIASFYEALLERKKARPLTTEEETRLDAFRREADVLMFRRGYAAVLLKRRGHRLPTLQELAQSSRIVSKQ